MLSMLAAAALAGLVHATPHVRAEWLFTVHSNAAEISFDRRPTPVLAVKDDALVALPTYEGHIGLFDAKGQQLADITFPGKYPLRLAYAANGDLLILSNTKSLYRWSLESRSSVAEPASSWWKLQYPHFDKLLSTVPANDTVVMRGDVLWIEHQGRLRKIAATGRKSELVRQIGGPIMAALSENCFLVGGQGWYYPELVRFDSAGGAERVDLFELPVDFVSKGPECNATQPSGLGETTKRTNQLFGSYWAAGKLYRIAHIACGLVVDRYSFDDTIWARQKR